ncbi:MAG TPA: TlpA disulfide reductase family protein [Chloroflexota bacterium]
MKSQGLQAPGSPGRRLTRHERRAQARVQAHQSAQQAKHRQSRIHFSTNIGLVITVLIVAAILAFAAFRTQATANSSGGLADPNALNAGGTLLQVGQKAPNFTLNDANGTSYSLAAQRGHPVLLEFFAVWCPVCHAEAPALARITRAYVPRGVRVWSILANPYGPDYDTSNRTDLTLATKSDLAWYASTFDVHHPQLVDPKFQTVNTYGINAYPGLYVVDSKGVISYASAGRKSYTSLSRELDRVLAASTRG